MRRCLWGTGGVFPDDSEWPSGLVSLRVAINAFHQPPSTMRSMAGAFGFFTLSRLIWRLCQLVVLHIPPLAELLLDKLARALRQIALISHGVGDGFRNIL